MQGRAIEYLQEKIEGACCEDMDQDVQVGCQAYVAWSEMNTMLEL